MIEITKTRVTGFPEAVRGARNSYGSWEKSDSGYLAGFPMTDNYYNVGENDLALLCRLGRAGSDEAKFRRTIIVYTDINAPLYWWKEYDTYKVGTVALSTSTMHSIANKDFTIDDFSTDHLVSCGKELLTDDIIDALNACREAYFSYDDLGEKEKKYISSEGIGSKKDIWWQMIQLLPSSYNQLRTVMLNYEVLANIYHSRRNHKLDEWKDFCKWSENLPYSEIFTGRDRHE